MRRRSRFVLVALVAALALLAGCSAVRGMIDTQRSLKQAGFLDPSVNFHSSGGFDTVEVNYSEPPPGEAAPDLQAARVVWETLPFRFDAVDVRGRRFTHRDLAARFPDRRSPSFDRRSIGDELGRVGARVILGVLAGGVLFVVVVVVVIVLIVRSRRKQPPSYPQAPWGGQGAWGNAPQPGGWPPPPGSWPQPPQPQGGWPPPPAGGWPQPPWPPQPQPQPQPPQPQPPQPQPPQPQPPQPPQPQPPSSEPPAPGDLPPPG